MTTLTLIIPAHNEEARIGSTIDNYVHNLNKKLRNNYEILIILNGCTDNSLTIVQEITKKHKSVKYHNVQASIGKGGAILYGFKHAKGNIIGYLDADDAFDFMYIQKMLDDLQTSKIDCIIASKWKGRSLLAVSEPLFRKLLSRGWNFLVRILLGLPFKDTQAGAKFFRSDILNNIGTSFICTGFDFDIELLYRMKKKGFLIDELYVPSKHILGSTFNLKYILPMFIDLITLWRKRKTL